MMNHRALSSPIGERCPGAAGSVRGNLAHGSERGTSRSTPSSGPSGHLLPDGEKNRGRSSTIEAQEGVRVDGGETQTHEGALPPQGGHERRPNLHRTGRPVMMPNRTRRYGFD